MSVLNDVTNGIRTVLEETRLFRSVEVAFEPGGKAVPAAAVSIQKFGFQQSTMNKWKMKLYPSILVMCVNRQDTKGQEKLRTEAHPIIEGALFYLAGNDLGGISDELIPVGGNEEEPRIYSEAGVIAYRLNFETAVTVKKRDKDELLAELKSLGISHFTPSDSGEPLVTDVINL